MNHNQPLSVLAQGRFLVDLGNLGLGKQYIQSTILKGLMHCRKDEELLAWAVKLTHKREDGYEQRLMGYVLKSIRESEARHIFIGGVEAASIFTRVRVSKIKLEGREYRYFFSDTPNLASRLETFRQFSNLRRKEPQQPSILVCSTNPVWVSAQGIFDNEPGASDGSAIYVLGCGSRHNALAANFYRCVNVQGKADGIVHSVVSLDSAWFLNRDFDAMHAMGDPRKVLAYFWEIGRRQSGPTSLPEGDIPLLGIETAEGF